jgi:hypothetical protein
MVDLSERVEEIKTLVDDGKYFTINRARQYGKTTTLNALQRYLSNTYEVVSLSFEGISQAGFKDERSFVRAFCRKLKRELRNGLSMPEDVEDQLNEFLARTEDRAELDELSDLFEAWCAESERKIVLLIDEVDTAANNQVFLDFLACLRDSYINRETKAAPAFQSVILAGVTDIKHLKAKPRPEDEHKVNSPWNIAADFDVDMSLSAAGIKGMLDEYEADHHTGMDTAGIAAAIRGYTNGYPYLVSRICQIIDEKLIPVKFASLHEAWTDYGVDEAVKKLLSETGNTLFDSLTGKLLNYPELKQKLRKVLLHGETLAWLPYDHEQQQLYIYGFIRNNHNTVAISNRIFEMLLYAHFIGESGKNNDLKQKASEMKSIFVEEDGCLNVPKIMEHFIKEHNRLHGENSEKFLEEEGRERFITYVSAIINGTGTYSIEEQTRDHKRMDVVIHFLGKRYVVELKIWRGAKYNSDGEKQIMEYLNYFDLMVGYMLSFSFNKNKTPGVSEIRIGDKLLYEGIV